MQFSILILTALSAVGALAQQQPDLSTSLRGVGGGGGRAGGRFGGWGRKAGKGAKGTGEAIGTIGDVITIGQVIGSVAFPNGDAGIYCNYGWAGNGGCEAAGKNTYCCAPQAGGDFQVSRGGAQDAKLGDCLGGQGAILCA